MLRFQLVSMVDFRELETTPPKHLSPYWLPNTTRCHKTSQQFCSSVEQMLRRCRETEFSAPAQSDHCLTPA